MAAKERKRIFPGDWRAFIVGVIVVFLVLAIGARYRPSIDLLEDAGYDVRMLARGRLPLTGKVAIVAIDEKSIGELGRWPWPRSVMASLVDSLRDYRAAVVGFDLIFSDEDDHDVQRRMMLGKLISSGLTEKAAQTMLGRENDQAFADAIRRQGSTYLGYPFSGHYLNKHKKIYELTGFTNAVQKPAPLTYNLVQTAGPAPELMTADAYQPPIEVLNKAVRGTGFVTVDEDSDGVLRTMLTVFRFHDRYCIPLSLAVASAWYAHAQLAIDMSGEAVSRVAIGDEDIPVDDLGRMLINYRGPSHTFPYYSAIDIIARRIPDMPLAGKIVLVGVDAIALGDRVATPMGADFPGVEVHANEIDNILKGDFIRHTAPSEAEQWLATLVAGLAISLAAAQLTALGAFAAFVTVSMGYVAYAQHRLLDDGVVLSVLFPVLVQSAAYVAVAGTRFFTEGREKRYLRHAFEHYLSPAVIKSLLDNPKQLKTGGERRHVSILFADIVDFTARAERTLSPEDLIAELNTYFNRMVDVILQSEGVVDKLIGDAIMAFWGAPAKIDNPARHAIEAALRMLDQLAALRREDQRFADFDIGIGIATGDPVVGNLGGEKRFDYSAIGDKVNFASRLEGLTREFGVRLLVCKTTLDEAGASDYVVREIGLVRVKGKHQELPVFEVAGKACDRLEPTFYHRFARIRELIANGQDQCAIEELMKLREDRLKDTDKPDRLIDMYLQNLNQHLAHAGAEPLREMVFRFDSK